MAETARKFTRPTWDAPLDAAEALRNIPEGATISGMFPAAIADAAKQRGISLPSARERYLAFRFYPLREHARLLLETCESLYWDLPTRQALRKLGRAAPKALISSTLGRVMLGSAHGVHDAVAAMAKAYPLNARPSGAEVLESSNGRSVVRLTQIYYFLDSHHVGAFEGVLKYAGVRGEVLMEPRGPGAADLLLTWGQ